MIKIIYIYLWIFESLMFLWIKFETWKISFINYCKQFRLVKWLADSKKLNVLVISYKDEW